MSGEELETAYYEAVMVLTQEQVTVVWAYVRSVVADNMTHSPFEVWKIAEMIRQGEY